MAETYEMYSETSSDSREYDAADFAAMFRQWFGSGVVYDDGGELEVTKTGDLEVTVDTGKAWVYGNMVINDAALVLTPDSNTSPSYSRKDRIICRNDITGDGEITIEVLKGTPAEPPIAPALTQTADTYEISLAVILITKGPSSEIYSVTDERTYATAPRISPTRLVFDAAVDMGSQLVVDSAAATGTGDALTKLDIDTYATVFYPLPPGAVVPFGVTTMPGGFLKCDGSAVSRTTYSALFSAIGTVYGVGDGSTTFNVPNLESRIVMGHSGAGDYYYLGATGGAATVALYSDHMPPHTHVITHATAVSHLGSTSGSSQTVGTPGTGVSGSTGGSGAHDNMPPYIRLYWGIKI